MRRQSVLLPILAAVSVLTTVAARADQLDSLAGRYAFNWHADPAKTKCAAIDQKLLSAFKSGKYKCDLKERTNTNTGKAMVSCEGQSKEYLIFKTKAYCEDEREAQASNE